MLSRAARSHSHGFRKNLIANRASETVSTDHIDLDLRRKECQSKPDLVK